MKINFRKTILFATTATAMLGPVTDGAAKSGKTRAAAMAPRPVGILHAEPRLPDHLVKRNITITTSADFETFCLQKIPTFVLQEMKRSGQGQRIKIADSCRYLWEAFKAAATAGELCEAELKKAEKSGVSAECIRKEQAIENYRKERDQTFNHAFGPNGFGLMNVTVYNFQP
jgi:hypothetical protein